MAGNSFVSFQPATGQLDDTYATDAELASAIASKAESSALNNYYTKQQSDGNYVASLTLGSTTTGSAGTGAFVTNSGTATNPILAFRIPRGNDGQDGSSAIVNIGTVSTGASGSAAAVINSGTNQNATLNFVLPRGAAGQSASVNIGSVTSGDAGTTAAVTNTGTSQNATLDFVLPRGNDGQAGSAGQAATVNIGTVSTGAAGSAASVTNFGSSQNATLNFSIPRGQNGTDGENATLSIGSVNTGSAGSSATVTNGGTNTNAVLNFQIPRGTDGTNGQNASVNIGTVTTGDSGTTAQINNSGTAQNATLDFTIPKGDTGDSGTAGAAATVAVGTVTTGNAGDAVSVTNSGSSQNATLNFSIPRGSAGQNASLNVGTTTTGDAGSSASVTNSGTAQNATFDFTIPKGDQGNQGNPGTAATVDVGSVTTGSAGSAVQVTNSGTNQAAQLDFTIPRGDTGTPGVAATVAIGSVTSGAAGSTAAVTNGGTSQNASLDFVIPLGDTGAAGSAATVDVGSVTTGSPGSAVQVTNSGTNQAAQLDFTIPRGDVGATGSAATVAVGTVTTGAAGSSVAVTNGGTSQNASLNFTIPQGATGSSDWESKLFIDDTPLSSGFLPMNATVLFRHFYPGHSDGYDGGSVQNAPSTTSTTSLIYYTKESLLDAFFDALDTAIRFVTRDAVYIDGNGNYVYEITKIGQTGYMTANSRIEIGGTVGYANTNTKLRELLGLGSTIPNNFSPISYYPTNIGTNKWRFTFPINIVGEGAEDQIFDEIGELLKYGKGSTIALRDPINFNQYLTGETASHSGYGSNKDWYIRSGKAAGKVVLQDSGGNVGVGVVTPLAKLHVVGAAGNTGSSSGRYFYGNSENGGNSGINYGAVSIYASSSIITRVFVGTHGGTLTASDERTKKEIVDVEDGSALDTLRLLKPKQYKYVDEVGRGSEPVWGFIAQEVRDTLPYATQTRPDYIPNIYETANVSNSNVITFTNFDTSNLESNAMVLAVYDIDDTEHLVNITEVIDEHSVRVDEDLSEWTEEGKIFVYGQQVDDFVFLKKDAIWTVATSALQEVDRQLQAEKARNDALEARILALEQKI
jgi:hypothetical protein